MRPATSVPGVVVRALHSHRDGGGVIDSGGSTSWADIAATARMLALGMAEVGVRPGDRVVADPDPSAATTAAELAVLATGATVVLADASGQAGTGAGSEAALAPLRWAADGLAGPWGFQALPDLLASGRRVDQVQPDGFERLVEVVDPDGPAFEACLAGGHTAGISHHAFLDLLRSLERAISPAVALDDDTPTVAVVTSRWGMAERLLGVWWPAMRGVSTWLERTSGLAAAIAEATPELVVASGSGWSDVADAIRRHPRLKEGSRLTRGVLGGGRAVAAGEDVGRGSTALHRAAAATVLPRVRADLGLGRCRLAVALGPPPESVRRDLLAIGVPLAVAWIPDGLPAPVAMTVLGSNDRSSGRPMPGWTITIGAGNRVMVEGPGARQVTDRTGRLDEEHRLWLGPERR